MIANYMSGAQLVADAESHLTDVFKRFEDISLYNQEKVLSAFQESRVALRHFSPTSGYGYDDVGRSKLGELFALSFGTEDALVRPQLASGTHAISVALFGLLAPGDEVIAATGRPYDTLLDTLGVRNNDVGSLVHWGINYKEVPLTQAGSIDVEAVLAAITKKTKVVHMQRSRGYAWRGAICVAELERACDAVKSVSNDIRVIVDNCYGEFTEKREPSKADILVGSLIKNPGGGIAPTGGYIAGNTKSIDLISRRLTAPGIGREVGSYAASYQPFFQGFFMAPHVVCQSLKTAALFSKVFELLGMQTHPASDDERSDIIQAIRFDHAWQITSFCKNVQAASPIDSFVIPEAWDMPGYEHKVIMAAGAFVQGASIEFSADAPIKKPYTAYIQGALTYEHGKLAAIMASDALLKSIKI